jgi:N4-gp56 family major capsid protein
MYTDFGALTSQQKKVWSALAWQAGRDQSFFLGSKGFMSEGLKDSSKPIHYVNELTETERGAKCVLTLVQDLQGDGVVDDNDLEGKEEQITVDDIEIQLSQLRHAVKNKGKFSEQKTVLKFRSIAKDKLAYWMSSITDEILFLTASGVAYTKELDGSTRSASSELPQLQFAADVAAPSAARKLYGGTATATSNLTASDKMAWNLLVRSKAYAVRKRINPIRINGKPTYIIVMSAEQARDLKLDNDYRTAVAQAAERGKANELFTGAFAMVDGLVLYEHNRVYNTLGTATKYGSGSLVEGAQALLFGAQALGYAKIKDPEWSESDQRDYQNRVGIGYGCMFGVIKPQFQSIYDANTTEDFAIISIYTAAAAQ